MTKEEMIFELEIAKQMAEEKGLHYAAEQLDWWLGRLINPAVSGFSPPDDKPKPGVM